MLNVGKLLKLAAAGAAMAIGLGALGASAATMTNWDDRDTVRGTLTCSDCRVWFVDPEGNTDIEGEWALLMGSMMDPIVGGVTPQGAQANNMSGPERRTFVNNITGESYSSVDQTLQLSAPQDDPGAINTFTTSARHILFWVGPTPRYGLILNLAAENEFSWSGTDISGIDGFGVIPLPASGWLMLGVFGVGAFAAHRKRKQKAA